MTIEMKQEQHCLLQSRGKLSPHISTSSNEKKNDDTSWDDPSQAETDAPTMSFEALSLNHSQQSVMTSQPQLGRCVSLSSDEEVPSCSQNDDSKAGSSGPCFPLIRKVSLEPKTQTPLDAIKPSLDVALKWASNTNNVTSGLEPSSVTERPKRRRNPSCNGMSLPSLDEQPSPRTRKRRRVASRNRALVSSDFDDILSQIDFL